MRSSMVLITSGKPRRKSAAPCLAASACPAAKSSSAASRSPVWFQSSSCSLRTTALFSSADIFISSFLLVRFPLADSDTVHDATRRCPVHPSHYALTERLARRRKLWSITAKWIVPALVPLRAAGSRRACPPPSTSPRSCPRPPDLWNGLQTRPACRSGLPPRTHLGACPEKRNGWPPPPLRRSAPRWCRRSPGRHDVSRPCHA